MSSGQLILWFEGKSIVPGSAASSLVSGKALGQLPSNPRATSHSWEEWVLCRQVTELCELPLHLLARKVQW